MIALQSLDMSKLCIASHKNKNLYQRFFRLVAIATPNLRTMFSDTVNVRANLAL